MGEELLVSKGSSVRSPQVVRFLKAWARPYHLMYHHVVPAYFIKAVLLRAHHYHLQAVLFDWMAPVM